MAQKASAEETIKTIRRQTRPQYHEALANLTPANVYFGRRQQFKEHTLRQRREHYLRIPLYSG